MTGLVSLAEFAAHSIETSMEIPGMRPWKTSSSAAASGQSRNRQKRLDKQGDKEPSAPYCRRGVTMFVWHLLLLMAPLGAAALSMTPIVVAPRYSYGSVIHRPIAGTRLPAISAHLDSDGWHGGRSSAAKHYGAIYRRTH